MGPRSYSHKEKRHGRSINRENKIHYVKMGDMKALQNLITQPVMKRISPLVCERHVYVSIKKYNKGLRQTIKQIVVHCDTSHMRPICSY